MRDTTRVKLPAKYAREMKLWRSGLAPMPENYIAFHRSLAEARLEELAKGGLVVHSRAMEDAGWLDGMRELRAVVETRSGKLLKLTWNDSNQDFMRRCDGGGWAALFEGDLR